MRPTLSSRSLLVSVLTSVAPGVALAQSHGIGFHLGRNDALPTETTLGGLSYTSWAGALGVRASGAMSLARVNRTDNNVDGTLKITAWTADADVLLSPFRSHGSGLAGLRPFGFLGIGGHGARYADGDRASLATWSYGWGLAWHLSRAFGLEASARRRIQLQDDVVPPMGFANDWEYRAGISIEFGGRRSSRPRSYPSRRDRDDHRKGDHDHARGDAARDDRDDSRPVLARPGRMGGAVSAATIVRTAHRYEGVRYSYGGASPTRGFDCSGFVQYVFARHGFDLPRTARQMSQLGDPLPLNLDELQEGDLLFFADNGTRIDHVAIYLGGGQIIHSTASGGGVRAETLSSPRGEWFERRWVASRRVVGVGTARRSLDDDVREERLDPPDHAPPPAR
jgi:hypothetical protein